MIEAFRNLNEEEEQVLYDIPVWVTILIAGADSKIDKKEIKEAISVTRLKKIRARQDLIEYYHKVSLGFESNLKGYLALLPEDTTESSKIIIKNLEKVNSILPKLERAFAIHFYESLKDLAKKVANASGGFMGFLAIGYEESKLIDLKMIKDPSNF